MYFSSSQQYCSMVDVALLLVVYNVNKLAVNHATEETICTRERLAASLSSALFPLLGLIYMLSMHILFSG